MEMSAVIFSEDTGCRSFEIAELVARDLGYECVGREVLEAASREYRVPEARIEEALTEAGSFLSRFSRIRTQCLAYYQASFTAAMKEDNVVYYGIKGHMFVTGVSHILKVMITANFEDRVGWTAGPNISLNSCGFSAA